MSSILKALQKLDRETADARHPDDPHRALRRLVSRKMADRSRGLMLRNAAFAAFVAVFLGAVSWAVWRHPFPVPRSTVQEPSRGSGRGVEPAPPPPQTESPVQHSAPPPVTHRSSTPSTIKNTQPIPPEPAPAPKAPLPSPPASPHASRPAVVKPAVPAGTPARPGGLAADAASKPGPGPLREVQRPPAPTQAAAPVRTTPTAPHGKPLPETKPQSRTRPASGQRNPEAAAPPAGSHKDIPVKSQDESGLTIQALVWSTAPEDRLVVVNGNILKEGGVIEGASVAFIGEDYIIMSQGDARWKLKFQLK